MKSLKLFFYLTLFLFVFTSCQDEVVKIEQAPQEEVLQANTNVAVLMQRTTKKDGSKDNIMDNASCLSVELPVTVVIQGIEIIIDSEEDLQVIEDIFDEFDDDLDELDFIFPIVIIKSDYTEITINNFDELENLIDECEDENEIDDDIECVDFVYPITLSIYNANDELADTVTIENDEEFYHFMDDLEDYHVVQINFPIMVVLYDGTEKTVNNMDELESIIDEAEDMCDEDDDNDYDDDDCEDCTEEELVDLLISCSWTVDKIKIDGVDNTEQYTYYTFWFLEDGTFKAKEDGGDYIYGTWEVDMTDQGIVVDINMENLSDFSFSWVLYEIEDDNEIDLRFEDNRLEFEKTCIDNKIELKEILNEGIWIVAKYVDNDENKTSDYNDFEIDFKEDFSVRVTKGDDVVEGTWMVVYDSGKLKLELDFGETIPFDEFNEDWLVVEFLNNRIEVNNLDNSGNEESVLVFERL